MFHDVLTFLPMVAVVCVVVLPAFALVRIITDSRRSATNKAAWSLVVVLFPIVGVLGWLVDLSMDALRRWVDRRNSRATG